jgi:hypothetical protein
MRALRRALEHRPAKADLHQIEVQRLGNVRVRQFAIQHGLHDFQTGFSGHHGRAGEARRAVVGPHPGAHLVAFTDPLGPRLLRARW